MVSFFKFFFNFEFARALFRGADWGWFSSMGSGRFALSGVYSSASAGIGIGGRCAIKFFLARGRRSTVGIGQIFRLLAELRFT